MQPLITQRIADYNEHLEPGEEPMTQKRLAFALGVTEGAVSLWVNGKRDPGTAMAFRIAEILRCSVDDLFAPDDSQDVNRSI